jgi:hypothetical protein
MVYLEVFAAVVVMLAAVPDGAGGAPHRRPRGSLTVASYNLWNDMWYGFALLHPLFLSRVEGGLCGHDDAQIILLFKTTCVSVCHCNLTAFTTLLSCAWW